MQDFSQSTIDLIVKQIAIVVDLQNQAIEAMERKDWQNVNRIIDTIRIAFSSFLEGIQTMAIDVSALKNVLTQGNTSQDNITKLTGQITDLQSKVSTIENTLSSVPNEQELTQLQTDVKDLKDALTQLNDAASSASSSTGGVTATV